MKLIHALNVVSIAFLLAACSNQDDPARAVEQAVAREILAPSVDPDQQLAAKVEKALGSAGSPLAYGVEVTASDGNIELWGTAASAVARKRFEIIAAGVVGVKSLKSHLEVDPGV